MKRRPLALAGAALDLPGWKMPAAGLVGAGSNGEAGADTSNWCACSMDMAGKPAGKVVAAVDIRRSSSVCFLG